uniref:Uncharacterized protein n=2 Tax=Anguilla anguilla TaxID=7936 RepID=A0A0E9UMR8_ANGAN
MCKNCSFVYLTTFMSHCKVWKTRLGIQQLQHIFWLHVI